MSKEKFTNADIKKMINDDNNPFKDKLGKVYNTEKKKVISTFFFRILFIAGGLFALYYYFFKS